MERLQKVALSGENIFAELMNAVRICSLGQITQALYDVRDVEFLGFRGRVSEIYLDDNRVRERGRVRRRE